MSITCQKRKKEKMVTHFVFTTREIGVMTIVDLAFVIDHREKVILTHRFATWLSDIS